MTIRVCGSNGRTCGVGRGAPLSAGCGGCAALGGVAPALVFAACNSGHVDCGNQILVDETNEDMTTRMLARLSEDSNRR